MAAHFSKPNLCVWQFCCIIASLWQPAIAKWFDSENHLLGDP